MGAPVLEGAFTMPMFRDFVPQLSGGLYMGTVNRMAGETSLMREDLMMCLYANLAGMAIWFPMLFRMKFRFTNRMLLLSAAAGVPYEIPLHQQDASAVCRRRCPAVQPCCSAYHLSPSPVGGLLRGGDMQDTGYIRVHVHYTAVDDARKRFYRVFPFPAYRYPREHAVV